jgi:5-formyltetrahydrofolate cyclo-ligase
MILPNKTMLRLVLQKSLLRMTPKRRNEASLLALDFLKTTLAITSCEVLAFASKPFEINLWPILKELCNEQRLLLPKVVKNSLQVYKVPSLSTLRLSPQKIQEPHEGVCIPADHLSNNCLILVPALGFDELGNRIGHGQGHYDKFLTSFPDLKKWGIGFLEQKCDFLPLEDHDVRMDATYLF